MTPEKFLEHLKRKCRANGTQLATADKLGVSEQYLSDVLNGRREPGASILAAMGFRKVVTYEAIK